MRKNRIASAFAPLLLLVLALTSAGAQNTPQPPNPTGRAVVVSLPAPLGVPKPGPATDAPYAPQPILQGGVVVPLYPPGSPFLKADRVREAEQYNMSQAVPGRISSIVNIHNPSIEVHTVDRGLNTGAAVILVAGGGHNTLNVGSEGADFVPFFYNYGVNTIILRNRLRRDGYNPQTDAVNDALQAIRMVRAYAKEWNIDPNKIGIMGFSAGAELAAPAAVLFEDFDKKNSDPAILWRESRSRPDFVGIIYPGPTPFARNRTPPPIPRNVPPAFIVCGGSGDRGHAVWAIEYFSAMLADQRAEHRDAHLRQRPPPRRPLARRQPHDRRLDGPQRHPVRHLAVSLHRLVPRSRLPAKARRGNQSRQGHRRFCEQVHG